MRLTPGQRQAIHREVTDFLPTGAVVFIYGSRMNDEAQGGDVDLLVRTREPVAALDQARLQAKLEAALGLPVDVLFVAEGEETTHFKRMICAQAQPLAA
jgi:predicted nucleotidyltransferase